MAGTPDLRQLQNKAYFLKRGRHAKVVVNNMLELTQLLQLKHVELPKSMSTSLVSSAKQNHTELVYHVPLDAAAFQVEGAIFTGKQQIQWVGQLKRMPWQFVLHIDGKYKMHHGRTWVLLTIGSHGLRCMPIAA